MVDNSDRRQRQKELDIRVIMGNPPYSAGKNSANDNNANIAYPQLDNRIGETYATYSSATSTKNLMDSYIRAIRWASDRLGDSGVMAYVSGSAWVERSFADGMRKCLYDECSSLYVFHLRGDIRKNMLSKGRAKEGGNIFGSGSMTGVAITILVKKPKPSEHGKIYYYDIGDDLTEKEKLKLISNFKSIDGITAAKNWQLIEPDKHNDWVNQRDEGFYDFIEIGNKKNISAKTVFNNFSLGVATGRDVWCWNSSKTIVNKNISSMIDFYNSEAIRYKNSHLSLHGNEVDSFIQADLTKISWNRNLKSDLVKGTIHSFDSSNILKGIYRPFVKRWIYFARELNAMIYQLPQIFPRGNVKNRVIALTGKGSRNGFSVYMTDVLPDLNMLEAGSQCFPLKLYETADNKNSKVQSDLFANKAEKKKVNMLLRMD